MRTFPFSRTTKRASVPVLVAFALALVSSAPAPAANPAASCSGLAGSSRAGQPGAEAQVQQDVAAQAADLGISPGALKSEFSQDHLGSAESCLG